MGFNESTRQNIRSAGTLNYVSGGVSQLTLPRVGYLARLHVHINGVLTNTLNAGTITAGPKSPWNLIRRIRFQGNNGVDLFNVSGYGAYLTEITSKYQFEPDDSQIAAAAHSLEVFNAPSAVGANTWDFGFTIPIVPNERDIAGLLLLQSEGLVTQCVIEWNAAGGASGMDFPMILTGAATSVFVGTATVYTETFTVPALLADQPPVDTVFQTLEKVDTIGQTGEVSIPLLRANTYARVIHLIELNAAINNADVDRRAFRYNRTEIPYDLERKTDLQIARKIYGRDLPLGVFAWEFFSQGYPNYGGGRDLVDANMLAELESLIYIRSGATLGTGTNLCRTITQQFVKVAGFAASPQ